jgi:glycosyltransferase involved in cell wall biosynthesis
MIRNRILFILDSLEGGGAQRVTLNILRFMNRQIFEPGLVIVNRNGDYVDILPRDIVVNNFRARRARFALWKLVRLIDKTNPAIIYSTTPYIDEIACIAAEISRRKPRIVLRSPNYVSMMLKQLPFYTRLMARYSYRKADMIITTTQLMTQDMQEKLCISGDKIRLIHNPLDLEAISVLSREIADHVWFQHKSRSKVPVVISMGRLVDQKGFSDLLKAFAFVICRFPARLAILGQGKNLGSLMTLAENLGITHNVLFVGFQPNPYKYLAKSDVFVLPSHWEGFPNALVEAMACKVPVISTDCPSGPSEIIEQGETGLLVPVKDPAALAEAILKVLKDGELRQRLAQGARRRSEDFSIGSIVKDYERVFKDVSTV